MFSSDLRHIPANTKHNEFIYENVFDRLSGTPIEEIR